MASSGSHPARAGVNPFVGPRPLTAGEKIYGRDREVRSLFYLLSSERIVLLHSPSGAGKSSLIQAGLTHLLRDTGRFEVWPTIRLDASYQAERSANRYLRSTLACLHADAPAPDRRLADVVSEKLATGRSSNAVLIFDQFEEILTIEPLALREKKAFFTQLGETLENPHVWALFALREDYLAALEPYLDLVPAGFASRFRLDVLGLAAAQEAIVKTSAAGHRTFAPLDESKSRELYGMLREKVEGTFEPDVAWSLVRDLATTKVQAPDGQFEEQTGHHVEPILLQVVCMRLWDAMPKEDLCIDLRDLEKYGDVNRAVSSYYDAQIEKVAGGDEEERRIRDWFQRRLISSGGIRMPVLHEKDRSGGLENQLIQGLRDTHLIRAESRASKTWYELAHDRLVEPVRSANKDWYVKKGVDAGASVGEAATVGVESYPDLEIGLHRSVAEGIYEVELRYRNPGMETEIAPVHARALLDRESLLAVEVDPHAYGEQLTSTLFADETLRAFYARARTEVETLGQVLRVRVYVGPDAAELHSVRWELLHDPLSGWPLGTSDGVLLSRFLASTTWAPVRTRPKRQLTALIAVCSPVNLGDYGLVDLDVARETDRAAAVLGKIPVQALGLNEPLTLETLMDRLGKGPDIVYLLCHSALDQEGLRTRLFLQDRGGRVSVVLVNELAARLSELKQPPRLLVLPGTGVRGHESSEPAFVLASLLADAGVPAILAATGMMSLDTVQRAMPIFFKELLEDGQVDRALTVARAAVRDQPDAWMLALFLRARSGRLWHKSGFDAGPDDVAQDVHWRSLIHDLQDGFVVPILGPGVARAAYGGPSEIARSLAVAHGFPLATHQRDDLAQVSKFLAVSYTRKDAMEMVREEMQKLLQRRRARTLQDDPYRQISDTMSKARVFIDTNHDRGLIEGLVAAGRAPHVVRTHWRAQSSRATTPDYEGDSAEERPFVFQMLGSWEDPATVVLTDDDYLDYVIESSRDLWVGIPLVVQLALARGAWLFLGFRPTDWSFQVLLRIFKAFEGGSHLRMYRNVAVMDYESRTLVDPKQARQFYAQSLLQDLNVSVYWGSVQDFLTELHRRVLGRRDADPSV